MAIKATVAIDDEIMLHARELVRRKKVKSFNALVETALRDEIRMIHASDIKTAIREAAADPLFLADIEETTTAFSWVDCEGEGC
jgi:hypothetical protein